MSIRQNGYVCYKFRCDHDGCSVQALMSSADQLSAAIRLSRTQGWSFDLDPGAGPAVTLCSLHSAARNEQLVSAAINRAWVGTLTERA